MRQPNVDQMLRSMTYRQYLEWRTFEVLEPFGAERDDYRMGFLLQLLTNVHRRKNSRARGLEECVPRFGDASDPVKKGGRERARGNWQNMKLIAMQLTAASGTRRKKRGA